MVEWVERPEGQGIPVALSANDEDLRLLARHRNYGGGKANLDRVGWYGCLWGSHRRKHLIQ